MKKIKYVLRAMLLVIAFFCSSKMIAQTKPVEEQKITPVTDLNNGIPQKSTKFNGPIIQSELDKYDPNRADFKSSTYDKSFSNKSSSSSGDLTDVGTPSDSPFQLGNDISGSIQNSVNDVTGKVTFSIPLAAIASGPVSYGINLTYDGQSGFRTGKELNKYSPVSIIGVGWSLQAPKIVVNNKQTTTREDDEFFIIDGSTNSKLICIDKQPTVYTFQLEKFANWDITYSTIFDSWTIIKDNGQTYYFGQSGSSNSKERISTWGNWIGDSNQTPTGTSTTAWSLSQIKDQWNNFLLFKYELIEGKQNSSQTTHKHTEASYLKEIISSKGAKIKLVYAAKTGNEFYETHISHPEPDAYQERFEEKYLNRVDIFNNENTLTTSYNFQHDIQQLNTQNKKRYLTKITQISHQGIQSLLSPSQEFEYHYSGVFQGGLKKVTYPSGGTVTYNYQNKYLFHNGQNRFETTPVWPSGYNFYSAVVKDNYSLFVMRTANPVTGNKHRFKIFRFWWNGKQWESNEFTFPHLMEDNYPNNGERLKGFYSVLENDFYAFAFDKGDRADVYLFHKEKNGHTWKDTSYSSLHIGAENPRFISGDDFLALGSHRTGRLWTYTWNGTSWRSKLINQGGGQYYYAATNNFILSLDEDGGPDMVTNLNYVDNYYIHYLDAEKKWQTKSWSAFAAPRIHSIEKPSQFYPGNSIAGFVADDNPELFLRWDKNYNLIAVDDVLGAYNDAHSLQPVGNSMFTLVWWWDNGPTKTARFNGNSWSVSPFSSNDFSAVNFGLDFMTYKNENTDYIRYRTYVPNTNSWVAGNLNSFPWYTSFQVSGINSEFLVGRDRIYKRNRFNSIESPTQIGTLQYDNDFTYSDGLSHAYVKEVEYTNNGGSASSVFKKGTYFYMNKETGELNSINLGLKYYLRGSKKLGGNTPFMSPKAIWLRQDNSSTNFNPYLYRIINDKFNQSVYDIVVNRIDLDDKNEGVRKVQYTYNNPNSITDNTTTFYGEVIIEQKGFGSSSNGKIKRIFNTGNEDVHLIGLQLEEQVLDTNNSLKSKTTNTWEKFLKTAHNGSFQVDLSYNVRLKSKKEEIIFNSQILENNTSYSYNSRGQLSSTTTANSKGLIERQNVRYAHEQYSFMRDKNMLTDVYETTTRLDNQVVNINRNIWLNSSGKAYIKEKWSGPTNTQLRLNSEVTHVDNLGNLLETSNGKDIYNASLNGYRNLYEVATIVNAKYQEVVDELDISYSQLQNLNTSNLKIELMKLYDRLPNSMISLTFYDDNGRVVNRINERKEESFLHYDARGRIDHITDGYGNVLEKKEYHFGN